MRDFFSLKQDGRAVSDYFPLLKGTANEILLYHPLSCDAHTRKTHWKDFFVAKFLSGLDSNVKVSPQPWRCVARSLLFLGHGGRGRGSNTSTNSRDYTYCGRTNHVVEKCYIKNSKPEWDNTVNSGGEPVVLEPSTNQLESIILSHEEYEQLLYCPVANSATPATSSSPGAFVASHGESWMLDSGATTHLTGNLSHFSTSSTSQNSLPVHLVDGSYSPISGSSTIQPTNHLTLTNVLFAPKVSVNLLSVSQLTKNTQLLSNLFPSYCVFQDLQTQRTIGGGHERGGLYFLDTSPPIDARALFASVSPLQWHCRLGHPSLPILKKVLPIELACLECESCELRKHHRASFLSRVDKRSSSPFTLIHSDI
ncbi:Retrovirus-related Pol polyprotein from transposon RE2 [Sesamum angolense]|uniref:Retrovirus-related Pol polyprotein from transposon RE2 n=1 Tax=Sesamum angolense TaxID=2727404 RepID=A0AAE1W5U8_9LAMI|nr:Retrovirus-related Pol polyprotein from transposon RE2 [Sesamum angolense]